MCSLGQSWEVTACMKVLPSQRSNILQLHITLGVDLGLFEGEARLSSGSLKQGPQKL